MAREINPSSVKDQAVANKRHAKMGNILALFKNNSKPRRLLVLGLDNAGKTSFLNKLKVEKEESTDTTPTVGFNVEQYSYKNITFTSM